ncbi:MAG TPA: S8 family serine peptidase [Cellvibrio sp.]|nr:S8 family serine peptidase [Cellvibrio sp.]
MRRTSKVILLLSFVAAQVIADEGHKIVGTQLLPNGTTTSLVQLEGNLKQAVIAVSGTSANPKVSVSGINASGRYLIRLKDQPVQPAIKYMKQQLKVGSQPNQSQVRLMKAAAVNQKLLITSTQNKLISRLASLQSLSKVHYKFTDLTNTVSVTLKEADLDTVRHLPEVEGVYPDNKVTINLAESVAQTNAPDVWNMKDESGFSVTGRGIKVAILDTGIDYTHPDLGGCVGASCKVRLGRSFVDGKPSDDFMDRHGHGTHVAGIVAANGTLKGVAPDALLYAFKVLDDTGFGQDSGIIAAMEKAVDPDGDPTTDDGADVINMSLGGYGVANSPLSEAANTAMNAGVMVVVAAGNSGSSYNTIGSPGNAEKVLTVGATDKQGKIAFFSSRGPVVGAGYVKPEVLAPGTDINSLKPGNSYTLLSGTSMAAPHVAGAAALMLQLRANIKPEDIKSLLMTSARGIGEDVFTQGAGAIDLKVAASLQWIIQNPLKFIGNVDVGVATWEQPFALNIKNISQQSVSVDFNQPNTLVPGFSLSLPTSPAVLEPLSSAQYQFKATADNAALGFPVNKTLHFETKFSVKSALNDIKVSAVLLKSAKITIQAASGLYSVVIMGRTPGDFSQSYRSDGCGVDPQPYEFYVKPGVYDALLYFCDGSIVAKESLTLDKELSVTGSSDDANLVLRIEQAKLLDGRVLSADNIIPHSGTQLLFHEPSGSGIYNTVSLGSKFKLSPLSSRFKLSMGVLYRENTTDWSDLYFVNWNKPDGITQGESKALDLAKLAELDFRYTDKKMVQQGILETFWVKETNPFLGWVALGFGVSNYPFIQTPLHRKIYSELTTLNKSEFSLEVEVQKSDPDYFTNSIASTDYIGFLSQSEIMKFSSPFFPLKSGPHIFPNKGIHLDGNGYFFPLMLRYFKDYKAFDEVDATNFGGWIRGVDGLQNRFYDVVDFNTYCDDKLLISGTRPLSPYPNESVVCDTVKIERHWENRYLDKVGQIVSVQQLDMVEANRSDTSIGWSTPLLETLTFLNGNEVARVLNSTDPKVKFSFKHDFGHYLSDKSALTLEYKANEGAPWKALNVELDGDYFVAPLPLLQGTHIASLRIKYKGTGKTYTEQTLNNIFVLGVGSEIELTTPEFSELPEITVEATGKLTSFTLPDVYAVDSMYGKIKAITKNIGPYALGKHTIVWSAKNAIGVVANASQSLVIRDTISPIVFAPADIVKEATGKETAVSLGFANAIDIVDDMALPKTASDGAAFTVGEHYVEWKAVDFSGNIGSAIQVVTIKDTTPPTVVAPAAINITTKTFPMSVSLGVATATDIVDGALTPAASELGPFNEGQHTVNWTVKDKAGNTSTATQLVTITREVASNNSGSGSGGSVSIGIIFLLFAYNLWLLRNKYYELRLKRS